MTTGKTTTTTTAPTLATWSIDPAHSHVEFAVKHLMISTVKGRFGIVRGTVRADVANPGTGPVEVDIEIDADSIDTREAQRDAHLKSADFFDVAAYPRLRFTAARVSQPNGGAFDLTGDLTIHGVTRPVTLRIESEGAAKDPWGGERVGFSGTAKIKRSDFGLTWNQVLEAGGVVVGDDVKISLDVELIKQ